jgi:hypothetical protein
LKLLLDVRDIFKCHAFHQTCVQNEKKQRFIFIVAKDIYVSALLTVEVIWLCNLSILSIPHEGYSRNSSWTVNLISTFLLLLFTIVIYVDQIERTPSQIVAQHSLTRQDHLSCAIRSILCFTNCNLWKSDAKSKKFELVLISVLFIYYNWIGSVTFYLCLHYYFHDWNVILLYWRYLCIYLNSQTIEILYKQDFKRICWVFFLF